MKDIPADVATHCQDIVETMWAEILLGHYKRTPEVSEQTIGILRENLLSRPINDAVYTVKLADVRAAIAAAEAAGYKLSPISALLEARAEGERRGIERAWQPIETAPKTDKEILLYGPCVNNGSQFAPDANVGWWFAGDWVTRKDNEICLATHWQPLPAPPDVPSTTPLRTDD